MNTGTLILKKSQEFALGGGEAFNILATGGDWNARGALISAYVQYEYSFGTENVLVVAKY